jgi:TolB-like protein/class 3 adenylate cyclase/Flp pilus assembly protein TadD
MPSENTEQRKLAAIMFTDMVGYSALAQRNDKLALELLEEHRQLLREIFPRFNGTEIKTIGDAFLIEFQSALEAAQCAIEIQRMLAKRNHDVTAERRIELKIGIHIGDVVHRGGDVYGDGVNIASRIEQLAGAGGICVSMDVERQIRNALEARFEKLAPTELKNISVPMDLFRIVLPWEQGAKAQDRMKNADASVSGRSFPVSRLAWVGAIVLAAIGAGWWWFVHQSGRATEQVATSPDISASGATASVAPAADQKSIAVLPFVDLSQAHDQEYFCDGISEEILDALAKVQGLRVVARTSSFSFKGKNADVGEIGQKLNVQNVLEGSLRREGNRIRLTAQLVNARDGFHVWSETYERELQGVFAVQDEITRAIVDALKIKLAVAPPARAPQNTEAYDLYLQGLYLSNKSDEESLRKSLNLFQQALDKDPNFARAWTGIAKVWLWLADAYVRPLEAYPKVKEAASRALALDERDPEAHCYLGESKRVLDWGVVGGQAELKRALQLDPNSGTAHFFLAISLSSQGEAESAQAHMKEAVKLDPLSPIIGSFASMIDLAYGRFDDAIAEGRRTQLLDPNYFYQGSELAAAYCEKGMFAEALELYKKAGEVTGVPQPGLAITYAKIGRRNEAERVFNEVKTFVATHYVAGEAIASICVALKDNDSAFQWLERAYQEHSGSLHGIAVRRAFRPLYSDPRFADLLKRIGLDPAKVLTTAKRF